MKYTLSSSNRITLQLIWKNLRQFWTRSIKNSFVIVENVATTILWQWLYMMYSLSFYGIYSKTFNWVYALIIRVYRQLVLANNPKKVDTKCYNFLYNLRFWLRIMLLLAWKPYCFINHQYLEKENCLKRFNISLIFC